MKKSFQFSVAILAVILISFLVITGCNGGGGTATGLTPAAGSLDTANFNAAGTYPGTVSTDVDISGTSHYSYADAVAIQTDGKIVVAGYAYNNGNQRFALARYNTDGTIDTGFGTNGIVNTPIGNSCVATSVAIQPADEKIVVAGYSGDGSGHDRFALARYNTDGSLDTTGFNSSAVGSAAGTVVTVIPTGNGTIDHANGVAIQSDGKIVVAGNSFQGTYNLFVVARYNTDGSLDTTGFGSSSSGVFTHDFGSDSEAYALAIQHADQKIVVAGTSFVGAKAFTVIRLNTDGTLDTTTFNTSGTPGIASAHIDGNETIAYSVALQSDGMIVVAGDTYFSSKFHFAVGRFTASGVLDTSFNSGGSTHGTVTTPIDSIDERAYAVVIQPGDQKIIAAGYANVGFSVYDFALIRYNTDGSLDNSFGTGGIVTTQIGTSTESKAYGLALQSDGKIIAAGQDATVLGEDFALARYWP